MSQANSPAELDIFEVFKVGNLKHADLVAQPLDQIQKTFTLLTPIQSKDQITEKTVLATVPKPGHIVVEKDKFKLLVQQQARQIAASSQTDLFARTEASIEKIKKECVGEVTRVFHTLRDGLQANQVSLAKIIADVFADESKSNEQRRQAIEEAIKKQTQDVDAMIDDMAATSKRLEEAEFNEKTEEEERKS